MDRTVAVVSAIGATTLVWYCLDEKKQKKELLRKLHDAEDLAESYARELRETDKAYKMLLYSSMRPVDPPTEDVNSLQEPRDSWTTARTTDKDDGWSSVSGMSRSTSPMRGPHAVEELEAAWNRVDADAEDADYTNDDGDSESYYRVSVASPFSFPETRN